MDNINAAAVTCSPVYFSPWTSIHADILRADLLHPEISGNKWYKLRFYLEEAIQQNKKRIITCGGAWSNHILATAACCRQKAFPCTGIIRGEAPALPSPVLQQAAALGMDFVFIPREQYSNRQWPGIVRETEHYFIPEGGYGPAGAAGAATMLDYCNAEQYSHICCACGTGTMTAGLLMATGISQQVVSVSVLRNNFSVQEEIRALAPGDAERLSLFFEFHGGGYARYTQEQIRFMNTFFEETGIPTDFVYTGKMLFGIHQLIRSGFFPDAGKILIIHSGGLPGNSSLEKGTLIF